VNICFLFHFSEKTTFHPHKSKKRRNTCNPISPSSRSGCHCRPQMGSASWQTASTMPSAVHCTARSPAPRRSTA